MDISGWSGSILTATISQSTDGGDDVLILTLLATSATLAPEPSTLLLGTILLALLVGRWLIRRRRALA